MRFSSSIVAACAFLLAWVLPGRAEFAHLGPVETLDNGVVTLQVAPRVGRVVAYHRAGEPNRISVSDTAPTPGIDWTPWGGDRVIPTAQFFSPQLYRNTGFDPVIDGQPWEILARTSTALEIRSGISPHLDLQITRRIELVAGTSEVINTFELKRTAPNEFPVHVWTVTGVRAGDATLMESDPRVVHFGFKPYREWPGFAADSLDARLLDGTRVLHLPRPRAAGKLGTYGRWIALVAGSSAFVQSIAYDPARPYLEASSLQAYADPERALFEIETLSPSWTLPAGESVAWTVRWRLLDFPAEQTSPQTRAAFLAAQIDAR